MAFLTGKKILIMGLRNKWSIAWGITKELAVQGAELIFTYRDEDEFESIKKLTSDFNVKYFYKCDVSKDEELEDAFSKLSRDVSIINGVVHSIAHAKREDLQNDFIETTRDGFLHAMNVSAYSLIAVSRHASKLMKEGGSILTLTYMGSERVFPGYNVMGVAKAALEASVRYLAHSLGTSNIRVNAISAGPIKTISAKGVKNFSSILEAVEEKSPLKRNVNLDDLGKAGMFLISDMSSGITGEILYVDGGYNIMGI